MRPAFALTSIPLGRPRNAIHTAFSIRSAPRYTTANRRIATMGLPTVNDIDGKPLTPSLSDKVLFVMNVASACGYTSSGYELFKKLTDRFDADKFAAIAVPCNSFGKQESGTDAEIKEFAESRVGGLYLTSKSAVSGEDAHPLIALARTKFPEKISWNFDGRYVIDKNGVPVARFKNGASDDDIIAEIERHL